MDKVLLGDLFATVLTGIGATALMDVWGVIRHPLLGVPAPDYGLVGRWLAWMPRGRFHHTGIAKSEPMRHEGLIGWTAHYLTGISFASLLVLTYGTDWLHAPRLVPALLVSLVTLAAPFLLMQPGMGAGIAASRTPRPNAARLHSLISHLVFGVGLYLSSCAVQRLQPLFV
ncbi:DUF2938 domain-containing protein [Uliginosibacterium sediminicola]|uniref:DUF2938 domain-containing protein n=1 Tax=Uliginosibacterium sediminicola TaxID=2024550 RepID=A0ABU9YTJ9_9RHOO